MMRRAVWICASLSIAAHALAVTLLPPMEHPVRIQHRAAGKPVAWEIRLASTSQSDAPVETEAQAPSDVLPQPDPLGNAQSASEPAATESTTEPAPPSPAQPLTAELGAPADQPTTMAAGANGDMNGLTEYIPRPQLSVPPVPQGPVIMEAPSGNYPPARITGILSLYIDETGRVHHIVSSGAPMPPEFEEAAKRTFMSLPFSPGVLDGASVKSRIRIEVVFDNTPLQQDKPKP